MPIAKYNPAFGGQKGSAAKAKAAMAKEYGADKGASVFYATVNKRKPGIQRRPRGSGRTTDQHLKQGYHDMGKCAAYTGE